MANRLRTLDTPHIVGAVVTCGAVLGIASMIHPTSSEAVPAYELFDDEQAGAWREPGFELGTLYGRGFSATIEASSPDARVFVDRRPEFDTYEGLSLEEFLLAEPELAGDAFEEGFEAWPEALMDVDPDVAPW